MPFFLESTDRKILVKTGWATIDCDGRLILEESLTKKIVKRLLPNPELYDWLCNENDFLKR